MKAVLVIAFLAVGACAARAQLDQILAPVATMQQTAPAQTDGDTAANQGAGAANAAAQAHGKLSGSDLLNELQKQLASYFALKGDLKLSFIRTWNDMPLPGKDFEVTLTDYPPDGVTSSFGVGFKVESGGIEVGNWQLQLRAQLWQSVWVSQGSMDRGQELDRSMLNSQKMDVLRSRGSYLSDDFDPDGYDVVQSISAGMPISKQDVIERPLIHRGDLVDVVAVQGLMDIHMKALALEDGGLHALIRMRNMDSSKEFSAQVLNENEVKVQF